MRTRSFGSAIPLNIFLEQVRSTGEEGRRNKKWATKEEGRKDSSNIYSASRILKHFYDAQPSHEAQPVEGMFPARITQYADKLECASCSRHSGGTSSTWGAVPCRAARTCVATRRRAGGRYRAASSSDVCSSRLGGRPLRRVLAEADGFKPDVGRIGVAALPRRWTEDGSGCKGGGRGWATARINFLRQAWSSRNRCASKRVAKETDTAGARSDEPQPELVKENVDDGAISVRTWLETMGMEITSNSPLAAAMDDSPRPRSRPPAPRPQMSLDEARRILREQYMGVGDTGGFAVRLPGSIYAGYGVMDQRSTGRSAFAQRVLR